MPTADDEATAGRRTPTDASPTTHASVARDPQRTRILWAPSARTGARGRAALRGTGRSNHRDFIRGANAHSLFPDITPSIIVGTGVAVVGAMTGATVAVLIVEAAQACAHPGTTCGWRLAAVPGVLALGAAATRLIETAAPEWAGEWRAMAVLAAAACYLWVLR